MKQIKIDIPLFEGRTAVIPVLVSWFPPRTKDQILANSIARLDGRPEPYEDPNLIEIVISR